MTTEYTNLLIKQYWPKPKARAEIELLAEQFLKVRDFFREIERAFDIDDGKGWWLDIVGKYVELPRIVEGEVLSDEEYQPLLTLKAAANTGRAIMASGGEFVSIQDVVQTAFDGKAFVTDNFNMTLTLYVDAEYPVDIIRRSWRTNLLIKPMGVKYAFVISYSPGETFGFSNNPNAVGFGQGRFARGVDLQ